METITTMSIRLASLTDVFASAVYHHDWRSRSQQRIDSHGACNKCTTIYSAQCSSMQVLCADRQWQQQTFHCHVQLERRRRGSFERWRQVGAVISNIIAWKIFVNQFRLKRLLMCVILVSLVYLSLLTLLYESLPPQLSELSETPHQPENQSSGARGAYTPRRYEARRSQILHARWRRGSGCPVDYYCVSYLEIFPQE